MKPSLERRKFLRSSGVVMALPMLEAIPETAQASTANGSAPVKRFVVEDRSMEPTLQPGQGLIAIRSRKLRRNQLRVVEHPERPGFWIVKRLGDRVDQTRWMLLADNSSEGQDSRHFGPVDMTDSWRIVVKIPQRWM